MKAAPPPNILEARVKHLDAILSVESTRGRVIVATEILNVTLAEILLGHLLGSPNLEKLDQDELLGVSRPLSSFSSRIVACYRLGLLSETDRKALNYLRDIRNLAAHECSHLALDDERIGKRLGQFVEMVCQDGAAALQFTGLGPCPSSCEDWFVCCCGFLMVKLTELRDRVRPAVAQFRQLTLDELARQFQAHDG